MGMFPGDPTRLSPVDPQKVQPLLSGFLVLGTAKSFLCHRKEKPSSIQEVYLPVPYGIHANVTTCT